MASKRVGGVIFFKVDGVQYNAKGNFDYNLGIPKREGVVGMDGMHGYKETPQIPYIEGAITDDGDMSAEDLMNIKDATIILELANGKVISLDDGYFAGEGKINTEEGEIEARFEGMNANEIR